MSLMGYKETDVRKMMGSISMMLNKTNDEDIINGLVLSLDFLQGILVEGRI